ncbi:LOW QUALITY PROTEIN: Gag-Pol polyprotein [Plecturocebus cupreus]
MDPAARQKNSSTAAIRGSGCTSCTLNHSFRSRFTREVVRPVLLHLTLSLDQNCGKAMHYMSTAQPYEAAPFEDLQADFTEMPKCGGHKYWSWCAHTLEALLTRTEKAHEVTHVWTATVHRIRQRMSICGGFGLENSNSLGYYLETASAYRPQSSRKVERMNQTIKNSLGKVCQETRLKWVQFTTLPGDHVWIKDWSAVPLKPRWKGPQTVILTIPTAVKVEGIPAWIHHSHVKPAAAETWEATPNPDDDCKIT